MSHQKNDDDIDSSLPSLTVQMRRAVQDLRDRMDELRTKMTGDDADAFPSVILQSAWLSSEKYQEQRHEGLQDIHKRLHGCCDMLPIDTICVHDDGSSWHVISDDPNNSCSDCGEMKTACQFKQQYCIRNVPCLIRGLDTSHFADVSGQWRSGMKINTEWFQKFVGDNALVPIRIDNSATSYSDLSSQNDLHNEQNGLDDDGRAQECETQHMKLVDWIVQCQKQPAAHHSGYLKDWHLVQYLLDKQSNHPDEPLPSLPLYTTPPFFERDLLNNFLQNYVGGDYKFVYWGPDGSRTGLHSDVMHTFSWSFNVVGRKKWIFHLPFHLSTCCHDEGSHPDSSNKCFEVIQEAGEAIFVPSTWKHEVTNLVETLSINHNWITSASIDQSWQCLLVEMASIENEVRQWGISEDEFGARENMLRGCAGLNVTMFALIILLEMMELLLMLFDDACGDVERGDDGKTWDCAFSIFRLEKVLNDVMSHQSTIQRLESILESKTDALYVKECADKTFKYVSMLKKVPK